MRNYLFSISWNHISTICWSNSNKSSIPVHVGQHWRRTDHVSKSLRRTGSAIFVPGIIFNHTDIRMSFDGLQGGEMQVQASSQESGMWYITDINLWSGSDIPPVDECMVIKQCWHKNHEEHKQHDKTRHMNMYLLLHVICHRFCSSTCDLFPQGHWGQGQSHHQSCSAC